jgi:putative flavoprotein involved in K+ transport
VWRPEREPTQVDLDAAGITSVIWSTGFGRDDRWIEAPVFDGRGYPTHDRGVTSAPGLYFLGLPWLHTWGSGRLSGVAQDAAYLARRITTGPDHLFRWMAGTSSSTYPRDDDWVAPRTVA